MAESNKVERRVHFRGKARPGRRVDLAYSLRPSGPSDGARFEAVTSNIGVGGAFILSDAPQPVGTQLDVELTVPTSDETIVVEAEVRWIVPPTDEPGAGMGVKFRRLDVESLLKLSEYFASLTGAEP